MKFSLGPAESGHETTVVRDLETGNYKIYEKTVFASFFNDKGLLCILENGNSNCR